MLTVIAFVVVVLFVALIVLSTIVILTQIWQFSRCATIAFSERYVIVNKMQPNKILQRHSEYPVTEGRPTYRAKNKDHRVLPASSFSSFWQLLQKDKRNKDEAIFHEIESHNMV